MMEESVFFNLGNALASSKDTKELMRTVQSRARQTREKRALRHRGR
jgi:hypothetical protein